MSMSLAKLLVLPTTMLTVAMSGASCGLLLVDDFQDGTTQGWTSGSANPNPPIWASGGPDGPGDGYLRIESNGLAGPGGNLVAFNTDQWSGDYAAAGVVAVRAELRNLGETDLVIRLLVEGSGGSFLTAAAASLPVGGEWQRVVWPTAALSGIADPGLVLSGVTKLRILHAPTPDDAEPLAGVLGVDDVTALSGDVCLDAGLARGELALCRVYCERLDCDQEPGPGRACDAIEARFERRNGQPPPCALDGDGDGWADDLDNCPDDPNPLQSDRDGDGIGDVCDNCPDDPNPNQTGDVCECPCFDGADIAELIDTLSDTTTYQDLVCFDERPDVKPLTFVSAVRIDSAPCGSASEDCSALAAEFTEDNACQYNPAAPADQVLVGEISEAQREACRGLILDEAEGAGLHCD